MRITRKLLEEQLETKIEEYETVAQLPYIHEDGWNQIETKREYLGDRLVQVAVIYGQIDELRNLLED